MALRATSLPFAEQNQFFRRKLNLPTNAWTDIYTREHDYAFVVAGANRDDLVQDFRQAVEKAQPMALRWRSSAVTSTVSSPSTAGATGAGATGAVE